MKSYSNDLRIKMFSYSLTHTIRETAKVFNVSPNTIHLLKKLFVETGDVKPRQPSKERSRLITREGEAYLESLTAQENDLTLENYRDHYEQSYGIRVSMGTMYNTLKKLNITYKKKSFSDPKKYENDDTEKKTIMNSWIL